MKISHTARSSSQSWLIFFKLVNLTARSVASFPFLRVIIVEKVQKSNSMSLPAGLNIMVVPGRIIAGILHLVAFYGTHTKSPITDALRKRSKHIQYLRKM